MLTKVGITIHDVGAVRLSGGQERLLSVLCVALARPWLVLLDEPFAAMDPIARGFADMIVSRFLDAKALVVLVEHSRDTERRPPDKIVDMTSVRPR